MFNTLPYKLAALREWNIRMSRSETPEIFDPVVAHVLREQGFDTSTSYEPRSVYNVQKLYEQLESFDPEKSVFVDIKDKHVKRGISYAYKMFAKPKDANFLVPAKYYDESLINNWKSSAGLTAFGSTKKEAFSRGILSAQRILGLNDLKQRKPEPCIALTRTGKGGKSRLVWGYPMSMTLLEGSIARPVLSRFKGGITSMAFATTNKTLGAKILSASQKKRRWYSLDASQFDATIQRPMIQAAFNMLRSWYDCEQVYEDNVTIGEVFDIVEKYFIYTPIVMPTGDKGGKYQGILHTGKQHGVPSGSYFTQIIDSIVNIIVLGTLASKFGFKVDVDSSFVLGDDLLFFTDKRLELKELATYASNTFGMKFNAKKSVIGVQSEPVPFLGRLWERGLPTRSQQAALDRMLWPESYRKYDDSIREGRLVLLSYSLSAIQDNRFIPNAMGWRSYYNSPADILANADKLSGYFRYLLTHTDIGSSFKNTSGRINLLRVLL